MSQIFSLIINDQRQNKQNIEPEKVKVLINPRPLVQNNGKLIAKDTGYTQPIFTVQDSSGLCTDRVGTKLKTPIEFIEADSVFPQEDKMKHLASDIDLILDMILQGYNFSMTAQGYSSAGKSYTIDIIMKHIIEQLQKLKDQNKLLNLELYAAFIECNFLGNTGTVDKLINMLNKPTSKGGKSQQKIVEEAEKVDLFQDKKLRKFIMRESNYTKINNSAEVSKHYKTSVDKRNVEQTNINAQSSRSHMINWLKIETSYKRKESNGEETTVSIKSEIQIIDLAGLESIAKSGKSCGGIGSSLMSIKSMMTDFRDGKPRESQRESKIQQIMFNNLKGNCINAMMLCLNPCDEQEVVEIIETAKTIRHIKRKKLEQDIKLDQQHAQISNAAETESGLLKYKNMYEDIVKKNKELEQELSKIRILYDKNDSEYKKEISNLKQKEIENLEQINKNQDQNKIKQSQENTSVNKVLLSNNISKINSIQEQQISKLVQKDEISDEDLNQLEIELNILHDEELTDEEKKSLVPLSNILLIGHKKRNAKEENINHNHELAEKLDEIGMDRKEVFSETEQEEMKKFKNKVDILIDAIPGSFDIIQLELNKSQENVKRFLELDGLNKSSEAFQINKQEQYKFMANLLKSKLYVKEIEKIFLEKLFNRNQNKISLIEDIADIMKFNELENQQQDSNRCNVIEFLSELMNRSEESKKQIFEYQDHIFASSALHILSKSSEQLMVQMTVWIVRILTRFLPAFQQYFNQGNQLLITLYKNQLYNPEFLVREKTALALSKLLQFEEVFPKLCEIHQLNTSQGLIQLDIFKCLEQFQHSNKIENKNQLLYNSGLVLEQLVRQYDKAKNWINEFKDKYQNQVCKIIVDNNRNNVIQNNPYDLQQWQLHSIASMTMKINKNVQGNIHSNDHLGNELDHYKLEIFNFSVGQNEVGDNQFDYLNNNQWLDVSQSGRFSFLLDIIQDPYTPKCKINLKMYKVEHFKYQQVECLDNLGTSTSFSNLLTLHRQLEKGKQVIVVTHDMPGREEVYLSLGVVGEFDFTIWQNEEMQDYRQVNNISIPTQNNNCLTTIHKENNEILNLYPEFIRVVVLRHKANTDLDTDIDNVNQNENVTENTPIEYQQENEVVNLRNNKRKNLKMNCSCQIEQGGDQNNNLGEKMQSVLKTGNFFNSQQHIRTTTTHRGDMIFKNMINKSKEEKQQLKLSDSQLSTNLAQHSNEEWEINEVKLEYAQLLDANEQVCEFPLNTVFLFNSSNTVQMIEFDIGDNKQKINQALELNQVYDTIELKKQFIEMVNDQQLQITNELFEQYLHKSENFKFKLKFESNLFITTNIDISSYISNENQYHKKITDIENLKISKVLPQKIIQVNESEINGNNKAIDSITIKSMQNTHEDNDSHLINENEQLRIENMKLKKNQRVSCLPFF